MLTGIRAAVRGPNGRQAPMPKLLRSFLADRAGATAVEYGLLTALIGAALISGLSSFGGSMESMLAMITGKMEKPE